MSGKLADVKSALTTKCNEAKKLILHARDLMHPEVNSIECLPAIREQIMEKKGVISGLHQEIINYLDYNSSIVTNREEREVIQEELMRHVEKEKPKETITSLEETIVLIDEAMATATANTTRRSPTRRSKSAGITSTSRLSGGPPLDGIPNFSRDNPNSMATATSVGGLGNIMFSRPDGSPTEACGQLPPNVSSGGRRPGTGDKNAASTKALGHARAGGQLPLNSSSGGGRPGTSETRRQSIALNQAVNANELTAKATTDQDEYKDLIDEIQRVTSAKMLELEEQQSLMLDRSIQYQRVLAEIVEQIQISKTKDQPSKNSHQQGSEFGRHFENNNDPQAQTHVHQLLAIQSNDGSGRPDNRVSNVHQEDDVIQILNNQETKAGSHPSRDKNTGNSGSNSANYSNDGPSSANDTCNQQPTLVPAQLAGILQLIKEFDGKPEEYKTFIMMFDYFVHNDKTIPTPLKLGILISRLVGDIAKQLAPAGMTAEDYDIVRENLDRQFNNSKLRKMELFIKLRDIRINHKNLDDIESSLNTYASTARLLEGMNAQINDDAYLIQFLQKVPRSFYERIFRRFYCHDNVTLMELINIAFEILAMQKVSIGLRRDDDEDSATEEVNIVNKIEVVQQQRPANNSSPHNSSIMEETSFTPPCLEIPCVFCKKNSHAAAQCTIPVQEKSEAVKNKRRCFNCLSQQHWTKECRSRFRCYHCRKRHFSGICNKKNYQNINKFTKHYELEDDKDLQQQLFPVKGAETSQ